MNKRQTIILLQHSQGRINKQKPQEPEANKSHKPQTPNDPQKLQLHKLKNQPPPTGRKSHKRVQKPHKLEEPQIATKHFEGSDNRKKREKKIKESKTFPPKKYPPKSPPL